MQRNGYTSVTGKPQFETESSDPQSRLEALYNIAIKACVYSNAVLINDKPTSYDKFPRQV